MKTRQHPPDLESISRTEEGAKDAINAALDLFHRRWALRILWELRSDTLNFRELQSACGGISTSVLNDRLTELRAAKLVRHDAAAGYSLDEHGKSLMIAARPFLRWAPQWARSVSRPADDERRTTGKVTESP